jgi:hypothetical protein
MHHYCPRDIDHLSHFNLYTHSSYCRHFIWANGTHQAFRITVFAAFLPLVQQYRHFAETSAALPALLSPTISHQSIDSCCFSVSCASSRTTASPFSDAGLLFLILQSTSPRHPLSSVNLTSHPGADFRGPGPTLGAADLQERQLLKSSIPHVESEDGSGYFREARFGGREEEVLCIRLRRSQDDVISSYIIYRPWCCYAAR